MERAEAHLALLAYVRQRGCGMGWSGQGFPVLPMSCSTVPVFTRYTQITIEAASCTVHGTQSIKSKSLPVVLRSLFACHPRGYSFCLDTHP